LAEAEALDVLCLQEHKLQEGQHCEDAGAALAAELPGWGLHWSCSTTRKGYSGTALLCRPGAAPLGVTAGLGPGDAAHEGEGRVLTAEYSHHFLVNVYVPNAGGELKRLDYRVGEWDPALAAYLKGLEARGKPVVLTGERRRACKIMCKAACPPAAP
jgi:exodeoxyribonuclease III